MLDLSELKKDVPLWNQTIVVPAEAVDGDLPTIASCIKDGHDITLDLSKTEIKRIGEAAFKSCEALKMIVLPQGLLSIGNAAFSGCNALTSIVIPEGLESIGDWAFEGCAALAQVTIPASVTSIGNLAFKGCKGLADKDGFVIVCGILFEYTGDARSVVIPEGIVSIGDWAFSWCENLVQVAIPASVMSIGDGAFRSCKKLAKIDVVSGNKCYSSVDGVLFSKDKNTLVCFPLGKSAEYYEIPSGATSSEDSAFSARETLRQETTPKSVTSSEGGTIGADKDGFVIVNGILCDYTGDARSVVIPEGVTGIGPKVFKGCKSLEQVTIPSSVTYIGYNAFEGCSHLRQIAIPEGITAIGSKAFEGCKNLEQITIPSSVTSIGNEAFRECSSLRQVAIPEGVTIIGSEAFRQCESLTVVTIPNSVTSIGDDVFDGCGNLKKVLFADRNDWYSKNGIFSKRVPERYLAICLKVGTALYKEVSEYETAGGFARLVVKWAAVAVLAALGLLVVLGLVAAAT